MEETQTLPDNEMPVTEEIVPTQNYLTPEQRQEYLKLSIPPGIKIFGAVVGLLVIASLYKLPKNLSIGIQLKRAEKASLARNYLTAQQSAEKVLEAIPDNKEALSRLAIASFYNGDFQTFYKATNNLKGVTFSNDESEIFDELNSLVDKSSAYAPSDSLYALTQRYDSTGILMPQTVWKQYLDSFPDEAYANTAYASMLLDKDSLTEAEKYLQAALSHQPDNFQTLILAASLYRQMDSLDQSLGYCNTMLEINQQNVYAMSSKARTLLKQKKDKEALDLALKAYKLNNKEAYCAASLAMAYHFNNKLLERDNLLARYKGDSSAASSMQFAVDVINQKEKFRN